MKNIKVVCAVIKDGDRILATQRGYGDFKDGWEFPGGKVENNESLEDAIKREIKEELNVDIAVDKLIGNVEYDYPNFHLIMDCFLCHIENGELILEEHEAKRWLKKTELDDVDWLPADLLLIDKIKSVF